MVIIRRPIRRLKDTFQCTRPYDELNQQQRITGRRVLSTRKLRYLPYNCDRNYNKNFNETSLSFSLNRSSIIKKVKINNNEHDLQQSQLKNLLINELKSFFINRNQNHEHISTEKSFFQQSKQVQSISSNKQIIPHNNEQFNKIIKSKQISSKFFPTTTTVLASISFLTNILLTNDLIHSSRKFFNILNFLSDTLFYSTSLTFACYSVQYIKQTKPFYIYRFNNIFLRSLLLNTCLTLFTGAKMFSNRTKIKSLSNNFSFTRQDIFIRLITSIFHLITGLTININEKNLI